MYVKNFIMRKLQGDQPPVLTQEFVQSVLTKLSDDDRIFRAIINSQPKSTIPQKCNNTSTQIQVKSEFSQQLIAQLEMSYDSFNSVDNSIQDLDLKEFDQQLPESEILKQQLQTAYRLYKATVRQGGNGMETITNHENQLVEKQNQVSSNFGIKCKEYSNQYGEGLDLIDEIRGKADYLLNHIANIRSNIQHVKQQQLKKQIEIVEKYKTIQRIKYTQEKLKILQQTFGGLAKKLAKIDDDAYQLIPVMKETELNIHKYKLNELNLQCIGNNFFENKIESLKERIQEGIFMNLLKFDENKYYSLLKSYFYIEKHYQMNPFTTQIWGLAKKSISVTFKMGIENYEKQFENTNYKNAQDEYLLLFYKTLYSEIIDQLLNFHLCNRFHQNTEIQIDDETETKQFQDYAEQIRQTYLEMRQLIWQKIQKKLVKIFVIHTQKIKQLQLEHLILLLGYTCLLIKRAEDFSHFESTMLISQIQQIYMEYVKEMHKSNLRMAATYLSNEQYQRLPIAKDQKLTQQKNIINSLNTINIRIFEYLNLKREENYSPDGKRILDVSELINNDKEMQRFYLFEYQNPFKLSAEEFQLITKAFWVRKPQQSTQNNLNSEIVLTQTSIRILEWISQYVILGYYMQDASKKLTQYYQQQLELYMFISYLQLVSQISQKQLVENFQQVMKFDENREIEFYQVSYDSYSDALILQEKYCLFKKFVEKFNLDLLDLKELDIFQSKDRKQFTDIMDRAIAIESLGFLKQQFRQLFELVGITINLQQFDQVYLQYKELLYNSYMQGFIKIHGIVVYIPQMKWEIKEVHNEHNSIYLDRLIQFILDQREKLKSLGGGVIPQNAQLDIFSFLAQHCLSSLIETYSKVKKVNNIGREQMINEFTKVYKSIEQNTKSNNFSPFNQQFISKILNYLKIFNSSNFEDIDQYIQQNKTQISHRLLQSLLVNCPCYINLKRQQKKDLLTKFYREYYDTFKMF